MLSRARELEPLVSDLIITGCLALAQPYLIHESGINARVCGWDEVPLAVGNGLNGSMKCRDEAYRQVIIKNSEDYGIAPVRSYNRT